MVLNWPLECAPGWSGNLGYRGWGTDQGSHPIDSGLGFHVEPQLTTTQANIEQTRKYRSRVVAQSQCQVIRGFHMCSVLHPIYSIEMLQQPGQR